MRIRNIALIAAAFVAATAIAGSGGTDTHYATYDLLTGKLTPTSGPERFGESIWAATEYAECFAGFFGTMQNPWMVLDWGDIYDGQPIGGFSFAYGTHIMLPDTVNATIDFYGDENGWNSAGRNVLISFMLPDLPGAGPTFCTWIVTLDLDAAGADFIIAGNDLDADGLADFGYSYWFPGAEGTTTGPLISGLVNQRPSGAESAFDSFTPGAEGWEYVGTWWFGCGVDEQLYMELYDSKEPCPNPGASGQYCRADIVGNDCVVGLEDLARLLAAFNTCPGDAGYDGTANLVQDRPHNCIDLADLAYLLSQYGDDCN